MVVMRPENKKTRTDRVILTDQVLKQFHADIYRNSVPELVKRTGLPYSLIYNIVNKRVKSISARDYRIIFSQDPPAQEPKKVDGTFFRQMVELWLYLNGETSRKEMFRDVCGHGRPKRVNYRIFSGQTRRIDAGLEEKMRKRFASEGLDEFTLRRWIAECEDMDRTGRIPYERIRPVLIFLQETLGVHPTSILNQLSARYESGELKSVSPKVYEKAMALKKKAEQTRDLRGRPAQESLREKVYGAKEGYTLFSRVEKELAFLQRQARKKPTAYLGRGTSIYQKVQARRIASWRARKILKDCAAHIQKNPHLPLASLPPSHQEPMIRRLLSVLLARVSDLLDQADGVVLEKKILAPSRDRDAYKSRLHGFTRFDKAPTVLGMNKRAFDLMVSSNCEIFREVGRYANRWYLSDLYLKELSRKPHFGLITVKYEMMARKMKPGGATGACMY